MTDLTKFAIHLTANPGTCRIVMNDYDISHQVQTVNIVKGGPMELPVVVLGVLADDVELSGEGVSVIDGGVDALGFNKSNQCGKVDHIAFCRFPEDATARQEL